MNFFGEGYGMPLLCGFGLHKWSPWRQVVFTGERDMEWRRCERKECRTAIEERKAANPEVK